MEFWRNKVAVITGAAEGIGAKVAEDLVKEGMTVIGFEPSMKKIEQMFDNIANWGKVYGQLIPCLCDISKDDDLENAFKGIVATYGGVDLLINNAAIGKDGFLCTGNIDDFRKIVNVNIYGTIACTRHAIQSMKKKKYALIININSICGHYMPSFENPTINMYIASKATMTALNTLLNEEFKLLNRNIRATSISPGIVRTGIFKSAGIQFIDDKYFEGNPHLTTKDVSDIILMVLSAPRNLRVNEIIFHALHQK
ncbi:farnesol dehydrogenase-like [Manduca sexta]|uniref:farnesol dehydrogenase-like n=1 Tax=Manduca sexta TaxID=7130 RepID=UPI0018901470|nr:farnesol dehydrogenase-like [Manduca sexta]